MGIKCFMLEEINERREPYGPPEEGHYHCIFDVRRVDTGEVIQRDTYAIMRPPVGAMFWEQYSDDFYKPTGPTDYPASLTEAGRKFPMSSTFVFSGGPCLCVMTPGGIWRIDTRASNCTMPYDYAHRCWIRHGEPPNVTVDKAGVTCAAGAGSIQCDTYHGFLRDGELT